MGLETLMVGDDGTERGVEVGDVVRGRDARDGCEYRVRAMVGDVAMVSPSTSDQPGVSAAIGVDVSELVRVS